MSSPASTLASSVGVEVAGYLRGGLGLGQAARLYVAALQAGGVPVRTTTVDLRMPEVHGDDGTRAQVKTTDFADLDYEGDLPFNLVCVNAPELPRYVADLLGHAAPCPVVRVPLPIEVPQPGGDDVGFAFGGDAFTFLFLFDF